MRDIQVTHAWLTEQMVKGLPLFIDPTPIDWDKLEKKT